MTKPVRIRNVKAYPSSFPLSADSAVTLGIGRTVKRDAVIIKVVTEDGLVGFGESHHGRCPGAVAHLVNTTLRQLVVGMDAFDVVGVWNRIYRMQLSSHGMGAAAAIAMSGIDMAATIHFLAAIDNRGYFEADVSKNNLFRDELVSEPYALDADGCVHPVDKPGIGVEVDEEFITKHPVIEGPAYV